MAVRRLDQEVETLNRTRERMRQERAYLSATDYGRVSVQAYEGRGGVERMALEMAQLDERLEAAIRQLWAARARAEEMIETLDSQVQRDLLRRRYMIGESWEQVAQGMHYGYRHIQRLHGTALEELRKIAHNGT